ncbi:MAG: cation-translocating P-type ATPase [Bacteroidetes bacterium]|nr:cation-translocating P-type ATPase [Bacteroidota bacterium]
MATYPGLSEAEAAQRLLQDGFNELPAARPKTLGRIAAEALREPMFLLLIACGVLYMTLGDYREGLMMLAGMLLIIAITFGQYRRTERALEALRSLASPRALVWRDGQSLRIPGNRVVRGDILELHEGDRIPADAVLLEAEGIMVDESLLTGESVPVQKHPESPENNKLFSSTLMVAGRGIAQVTETGASTRFGSIGASLNAIQTGPTRLQSELKRLIRVLGLAGIGICIMLVFLFFAKGTAFIPSLLHGLSAAMAILPEEFPVVMTVFLALGAWRLSRSQVLTRQPAAIETLGASSILCTDKTGTITLNKMSLHSLFTDGKRCTTQDPDARNLLHALRSATPASSSDPMEHAIHESWEALGDGAASIPETVKEYPLKHGFPAMSHVYREGNAHRVYAKGAPELLIRLCLPDTEQRRNWEEALTAMASEGLRVIAVATAQVEHGLLPEEQRDFAFELLGLAGLKDPVRPEVPGAVNDCARAGIRVLMITGDYPLTASSIAKDAGISGWNKVLSGAEIEAMSDAELRECLKSVSVCARVVPGQKLRIVEALKADGEVVAMTGDGVNDAPALKAADIGVAMGGKGTDVAREAASLVLLDDNFASIVAAVRLGRRIYDNLGKAMSYILAIHLPIIVLTMLPAFLPETPVLLLPLHIVFMELIIDPVCSIAFESEQEEPNIMQRPPRKAGKRFFGLRDVAASLAQGLLLLAAVVAVYAYCFLHGYSEGSLRATTFSTLILGNMLLILTGLSRSRSVWKVLAEGNKALLLILGIASGLLTLILLLPGPGSLFSFEKPALHQLLPVLPALASMLFVLEMMKLMNKRVKRMAAS